MTAHFMMIFNTFLFPFAASGSAMVIAVLFIAVSGIYQLVTTVKKRREERTDNRDTMTSYQATVETNPKEEVMADLK